MSLFESTLLNFCKPQSKLDLSTLRQGTEKEKNATEQIKNMTLASECHIFYLQYLLLLNYNNYSNAIIILSYYAYIYVYIQNILCAMFIYIYIWVCMIIFIYYHTYIGLPQWPLAWMKILFLCLFINCFDNTRYTSTKTQTRF